MGFNIHQAKKQADSDSSLVFFSDLFAALSFIFLFLYITATLQNNALGVAESTRTQKMEKKYQKKLAQVINTYETQAQAVQPSQNSIINKLPLENLQYLDKELKKSSQNVYQKVLTKVDAIEKGNLEHIVKRKETIQKEMTAIAQMEKKIEQANSLRNMVDSMLKSKVVADQRIQELETKVAVAQKTIVDKKTIIQEKEQVIIQKQLALKEEEIKRKQAIQEKSQQLKKTQKEYNAKIAEKEEAIRQQKKEAEREIAAVQTTLEEKMLKEISAAKQKTKKLQNEIRLTQSQYEEKMEKESLESLKRINHLKQKYRAESSELASQLQAEIKRTKTKYLSLYKQEAQNKNALLAKLETESQKHSEEKLRYKSQLIAKEQAVLDAETQAGKYRQQIKLISGRIERLEREKDQLSKQKYLTEQEKGKLAEINDQLNGEYNNLQNKYSNKASEAKALTGKVAALTGTNKKLRGSYQEATRNKKIRANIARKLSKAFADSKVPAKVDGETGEVIIPFREAFFEFGAAKVTEKLAKTLESVFPSFAGTIFEDATISSKIASLELIGYSSPIYKGVIVYGTKWEKQALGYNLDLSYQRARAIFRHIFTGNRMKFDHQARMMKLTKVTSVGHNWTTLKQIRTDLPVGDLRGKDLCKVYDCLEWQKVSIRINLVGD